MNNKMINTVKLIFYFGILETIKYLNSKPMQLINEEEEERHDNTGKTVVYTAIFGNMDMLKEPECVSDNVDYVVITDSEIPSSSKWEKYDNSQLYETIKGFDNRKKNRYCKLFPNELFPEYKYSIYIDGQIRLCGDISKYVTKLKSKPIAMFGHPYRDDTYMEAMAVVKLNNANPQEVKKQIAYYRKEGCPEKYGLFENGLIVREHCDKRCASIMKEWWIQLNRFTMRDQLSFMYSLWKSGYDASFVKMLGVNMRKCEDIKLDGHGGANGKWNNN